MQRRAGIYTAHPKTTVVLATIIWARACRGNSTRLQAQRSPPHSFQANKYLTSGHTLSRQRGPCSPIFRIFKGPKYRVDTVPNSHFQSNIGPVFHRTCTLKYDGRYRICSGRSSRPFLQLSSCSSVFSSCMLARTAQSSEPIGFV